MNCPEHRGNLQVKREMPMRKNKNVSCAPIKLDLKKCRENEVICQQRIWSYFNCLDSLCKLDYIFFVVLTTL